MSSLLFTLACTTSYPDSPPVYAGWSLEAQASGGGTSVPGQTLQVPFAVSLAGVPECEDCAWEQQAELQLSVRVPADSGAVTMSLVSSDERVVVARQLTSSDQAQRVLLSAPLFQGCAQGGCLQTVYLVVDSPSHAALSWRVQAQSVSTHGRQDWDLSGVELRILES